MAEELLHSDLVITTGVGKAGDVARLGASLLQSVGVPASFIHATDLLHGGLSLGPRYSMGILIAVSHSGTTVEVQQAISLWGGKTWLMTGSPVNGYGLVDRRITYDIERDGSMHGTIPVFSAMKQIEIFGDWTCQIANEMSPEELKAGHPAGNLAVQYQREMDQQ